ncbi:MAG: hypothetical protein KDA24_26855 [Deltaproteobacteria bacterium]|nr:hypothetical protein [Deltaproteobacteria bacterium]
MQLSPIDRFRLARGFFAIARDPRNLDGVLDLADNIAKRENAFDNVSEELRDEVMAFEGAGVMPPPEELRELADGTLGREYVRFMDEHGLTPEALDRAPEDGNQLEVFRAHMRNSHDIWHVATGWTPDLLGELALQAFYLAQLRLPFPAFVLAAGMLHVVWKSPRHFYEVVDAVAEGYRQGREATPLAPIQWVKMLDLPVNEVRDALQIAPATQRPEPVIPLVA